VTWQLFTNEREQHTELIDVIVPNEITLSQLVAAAIYAHFEGKFDVNTM
jgi:hypothetical protein